MQEGLHVAQWLKEKIGMWGVGGTGQDDKAAIYSTRFDAGTTLPNTLCNLNLLDEKETMKCVCYSSNSLHTHWRYRL